MPTRPNGTEPVFLSLESGWGPATVFDADGQRRPLQPGGPAAEVKGLPRGGFRLPASGLH